MEFGGVCNEERFPIDAQPQHTLISICICICICIVFFWKVVLVGQSGVGKTSLLYRYLHQEFNPSISPTLGVDLSGVPIDFEGTKMTSHIWDTSGVSRFAKLSDAYVDFFGEVERIGVLFYFVSVRIGLEFMGFNFSCSHLTNASAAIMVYDITNRASFLCLELWLEKIREKCKRNAQIWVLGNKCDCSSRQVSEGKKKNDLSPYLKPIRIRNYPYTI